VETVGPAHGAGMDDPEADGLSAGTSSGPARAVRAAGGVVCRPRPDGRIEVAIVHRPVQDDWTLPKGKLNGSETPEQAALREVFEETGLRAQIQRPAGCTAYVDGRGRDKTVYYWVMRPVEGQFKPSAEVDELRWLPVEEAMRELTYPVDRALLAAQDLR
jgi:8-oxo-(d)GTP phosphatase